MTSSAGTWVDELLLGRHDELRRATLDRQTMLAAKGLNPGGTVALWQRPSVEFMTNLLAVWRSGGRVILFDHRLTRPEVDRACSRLQPQLLINTAGVTETRFGLPAMSDHVLIQLTSGSTGPAKIVGRTRESLMAELDRYTRMAPLAGERVVVLASTAHTLGLVGGVLHGLNAGAEVVLPSDTTGEGIVRTIAADNARTTVVGVPFHLEQLTAVPDVPALPQLERMIVGGEVVRPQLAESYYQRFSGCLGRLYGMTETGVLAEDLSGWYRPALAPCVPMRAVDGELQVQLDSSPYLDAAGWDGWLRTHDAGVIEDGLVTVLGRLDARVTVGGNKVDLMEVERVLSEVPGVREAVVVYDRGIVAYVASELTWGRLHNALAARLAPGERPLRVHLLDALPRTATGKLVRSVSELRAVETSAA